ncbi:ER-bound oxygenase [Holotrichia oblita]|uniref:ER-bound oxygenase n=1 Tax=Holotrichia oblita TaxID=644536 RepID=A0ACB9TQP6_HOLOL|nr:ER-bound oxygenase [Holotrichia oblita]
MLEEDTIVPSEQFLDEVGKFSGTKFINYLESEGSKVLYDNTKRQRDQLPPYYDEIKFKRAQNIFVDYAPNLLVLKLAGLITLLNEETSLRIIMMTKNSSTPETACTRYRDTVKHVMTWYTSDFQENSTLWQSIHRVKMMHHSANSQARKIPDMPRITQLELAGTIFGFIGFAIIRPECFGLTALTDEDYDSLVHFWRVIGHLLGVEDRFNICRDSLSETKAIFHALADIIIRPHMLGRHENTLHMQLAAIRGISMFTAPLHSKVFLNFTYDLVCWDNPLTQIFILT